VDNLLYSYSPMVRRPHLELPGGARVAFWVGLAIERYLVDKPGMSIGPHTASFKPDPLNFGWRDYGLRVGVWRMVELFERYSVPVTALLNSDVCTVYPEVIEEGVNRDWAWVAHGKNNNAIHQNISREEERAVLAEMTETIKKATGKQPTGWIGPVLTETFDTPELLQGLGYTYLLDWCSDDQPFPLNVPSGRMISVPYLLELNDATVFVGKNLPGADWEQALRDHFDVLYKEGVESARVMGLGLHPWIVGQPFRMKYLENAIAYITQHDDVWLTTSDDIADWYMRTYADGSN
jgi:allantoinase